MFSPRQLRLLQPRVAAALNILFAPAAATTRSLCPQTDRVPS